VSHALQLDVPWPVVPVQVRGDGPAIAVALRVVVVQLTRLHADAQLAATLVAMPQQAGGAEVELVHLAVLLFAAGDEVEGIAPGATVVGVLRILEEREVQAPVARLPDDFQARIVIVLESHVISAAEAVAERDRKSVV